MASKACSVRQCSCSACWSFVELREAVPDLQVAEQKRSLLEQGLTTVTVRLALPTLPALSVAEYVTM